MNDAIKALIEEHIAQLEDKITTINGHITSMDESLTQAHAEQNARITQRDEWALERDEFYAVIHGEQVEDDDSE